MAQFCFGICWVHSEQQRNEIPPYATIVWIKWGPLPSAAQTLFIWLSGHTFVLFKQYRLMKIACRSGFSLQLDSTLPILSLSVRVNDGYQTLHTHTPPPFPHQKTRFLLKAKHQDALNSLQAIKGHRLHFIQRLQGCTSLQCGQVDMLVVSVPFICLWDCIIKKRMYAGCLTRRLWRFFYFLFFLHTVGWFQHFPYLQ